MAHGGHAEFHLNYNVPNTSINCEFYMKFVQKFNVAIHSYC